MPSAKRKEYPKARLRGASPVPFLGPFMSRAFVQLQVTANSPTQRTGRFRPTSVTCTSSVPTCEALRQVANSSPCGSGLGLGGGGRSGGSAGQAGMIVVSGEVFM